MDAIVQDRGYALALAGGGAKGIYQIGAWRALREMQVPICAVAGTSIGAINGVLFVQNDYELAEQLWSGVSLEQFFTTSRPMRQPYNLFAPQNTRVLVSEIIKARGLDATPLRNMLSRYVDERKIRASGKDFGLVALSLRGMRPMRKFIDQMPEGSLVDYLLASSRFLGLRPMRMEREVLIDGGFADNMPLSMLRDRGYSRLMGIDIVARRDKKTREFALDGAIVIGNSQPLGAFMDMRPSVLAMAKQLGYLDTLHMFKKLLGKEYFFFPDDYREMCRKYTRAHAEGLERAARWYGLDRVRAYTLDQFERALLDEHMRAMRRYDELSHMNAPDALLEALRYGRLTLRKRAWRELAPLCLHALKHEAAGGIAGVLLKTLLPEEQNAVRALDRFERFALAQ